METLSLKPVKAYTIYSSDDDRTATAKGTYKDFNVASVKAVGCGWYGSNGSVQPLNDVYEDENGEIYRVKKIGQFTDVAENYKKKTLASIKSKLSKEELELLGVN